MDIIEKLVVSLLNVSTRKIIVYGINCKVPFNYPNLIKREYVSPVKSEHDKWFWKQQTCIEVLKEKFNNYVWVDGDIIANYNIDNISNYFKDIINYPLGEVHVQDEQTFYNADTNISQCMGEYICKHYGIKRKVIKKDLHACFFVFNEKCKWFFEEIISLYNSIYDQGLYDKLLQWNDESLLNFMHSKYNFTKTLPLSNLSLLCQHSKYESNPNVLKFFYSYWNNKSPNNFGDRFGWNYIPEDKNQILYFHENKNLDDADEMIEFIKMKKDNNFNNSKWFFVDKYKIHNFELNRSDYIKNKLYDVNKLFEYKNVIVSPNDTVVDIGAWIGVFERFCYLKNASKIICFESKKENFELLKLNAHKDTILFNSEVTNKVEEINNINTYNINYLFETKLVDKIDFLKIDSDNEELILTSISDSNLEKINKISMIWCNKDKDFLNYISIKGFNYFINESLKIPRLYLWKK